MRHIYEAQALAQYVKARLPHIKGNCVPIRLIEDDTSTVANADFVHNRIGSTVKPKVFLDDCYHVVTMDNERELSTSTLAIDFFDQFNSARHEKFVISPSPECLNCRPKMQQRLCQRLTSSTN